MIQNPYKPHTAVYASNQGPATFTNGSFPYASSLHGMGLQPPPASFNSVSMPSAPEADTLSKEDRLNEFFRENDIAVYIREDIWALTDYEIILICDDSGSMKQKTDIGTRWSELKDVAKTVIGIGSILDDDGVDIWFLNRSKTPFTNVNCVEEVEHLFEKPPSGRTPLTRVLEEVMATETSKQKLIIIATDGVPTNSDGYPDIEAFSYVLMSRDADWNRISILACTDNDREVGYLNDLDKKVDRLDVIDDYDSERAEVLKVQGKNFPFSRGDYIMKMLLGPVMQRYDDLDEKRLYLSADGSIDVERMRKHARKACIVC